MADYDDYLYSDFPHAETHPSRLFALGRLFGLSPRDPARCRVLELGCGLGGNPIAIGAALPGSTVYGVDRSPRQIAAGKDVLRALGLSNVALEAADLCDLRPAQLLERAGGPFDYVICHGLYSWVKEEVQASILSLARACLAEDGLLYLSYNTLPGWHLRGMVRDLLRRAAGDRGTPQERIARARSLLAFFEHLPEDQGAAQAFLAGEVRLLGALGDEYLFYEHLVEDNRPEYFPDLARKAQRAGLRYVSDAHFGSALPERFGPAALQAAREAVGEDPIEIEGRLDLLEVRLFRRSVLCQEEAAARLAPASWERLAGLHVTTSLTPLSDEVDLSSEAAEDFRGAGNRGVSVHRPLLKAALLRLHEERPGGLVFEDLCAQAHARLQQAAPGPKGKGARKASKKLLGQLGESLLDLLARGFLELHGGAPSLAARPGTHPRVTALARLQAGRDQSACTNLKNESISVDDLDRCLLRRLDGSYDLETLGEMLLLDTRAGDFSLELNGQPVVGREAMTDAVRRRLEHLARAGFLLG